MDSRSRLIQRHSLELRRTMSPRSWLCYRCAHSQIQNIPPFHNKAVVSGGCMPTAPGILRRYLCITDDGVGCHLEPRSDTGHWSEGT